jgi:hypothetical protein
MRAKRDRELEKDAREHKSEGELSAEVFEARFLTVLYTVSF